MTASAQDFKVYAGDAAQVRFAVTDGNGVAIDISTVSEITWTAQRDLGSAAVLTKTKTGGAITLPNGGTDGIFQLALASSDTTGLTGYYLHTAVVTDSSGNISTVTTGRMQVGQAPVWTYSGDPSLSDRDAVRSWIGDTDESSPQLYDKEIDYALTQFANPLLAAAQCARTIAGRYATKVNKRVGDLAISYSDIAKSYRELAASLQTQGEASGVTFYAGGTSKADRDAVADNSDRPKSVFRIKQFDIPNSADTAQIPTGDDDDE